MRNSSSVALCTLGNNSTAAASFWSGSNRSSWPVAGGLTERDIQDQRAAARHGGDSLSSMVRTASRAKLILRPPSTCPFESSPIDRRHGDGGLCRRAKVPLGVPS